MAEERVSVLRQLSDELAALVAQAGSSVVRVEGRPRGGASGLIWSAEGIIITADHVLERDEDITVGLPDGQEVKAALVGRDPATDIALLRIPATGLPPAPLTESRPPVGHLVLALARPVPGGPMATIGVVSAIGGPWRSRRGSAIEGLIQTDVTMYPGFSGGPLVGADGLVLGLNTSALVRGLSLTIPTAALRPLVDALLTHGRVRRGFLGVSVQVVSLPPALRDRLGQPTGLLVAGVEPGGPAEQSGVLLGDVLVALAGQPLRTLDDLQAALSGERVGQTVPALVVRAGQVIEVAVRIGERP